MNPAVHVSLMAILTPGPETDDSLLMHISQGVLKKLNVDSGGRLRVSAESVASHAVTLSSTSVTTCATTSFAGMTIAAYEQLQSNLAYQSGFRRNLVIA